MFINYEDFEDKDKVYDIIKFINKIADIISYTRKSKSSLFKIDFNNILKVN